MAYHSESGGNYLSPITRRAFLRAAGAFAAGGLAARLVPNYPYQATPQAEMEERFRELKNIRAHNRTLAQRMLATDGIEAVRKGGFEHYLIDPELQQMDVEKALREQPETFFINPTIAKMLVFSGASGIAYATGPRLADKMQDAYLALQHKARAGQLNSRELKAYAGIAMALGIAAGCGGGGGNPLMPTEKATIVTRVVDSSNNPVNGTIAYLDSANGQVIASGSIANGSSLLEDVSGTIRRVRVQGNGSGNPAYLTLERDLSQQINSGHNNVEVMVKARTPNLPLWYNETNRRIYPVGNKKTVGAIKFIANPAEIISDPSVRIRQVEDAVKYAAPILAGSPYVEGDTFQVTDSTIEPGGNVFPIRFAQAFGTSDYVYDGNNRLLGTLITLPRFASSDLVKTIDVSEIAEAVRFKGESNSKSPSIANDAPPHGIFEGCDLEALAASEFDALGAKEFMSAGGVMVDSWWMPSQR